MALKVNPNRMELLKLRRRAEIAKRGHKLLKDKLDEIMKRFLALIDRARDLREEVEEKLAETYRLFAMARAEASSKELEEALLVPKVETKILFEKEVMLNVEIPRFNVEQKGALDAYGLLFTPAILDEALNSFSKVLPLLVELAQLEKTIELLAQEIERTRRRVNALEHVLIPQLEETITFITMKLDEMERADRTRLMKIKEIVAESTI